MDDNNLNSTPMPETAPEPVADSIVDAPTPIESIPESPITPTAPKKGKGLKIGLIVSTAVLLAGGAGFGAYAYVHTTPENVMLGTFSNLMNTKNITVKGKAYVSTENAGFFKSIEVSIDEKSSRTDDQSAGVTATFTIKVEINGEEKEFSISTSEVVMKNGIFYFKVDGIEKILDEVIDLAIEAANAELRTNCLSSGYNTNCASLKITRKDLPAETKNLLGLAEDLVGEIDGSWWKVSVDDLIDSYGKDYFSSKERTELKDAYSCLVEQIHTEFNKSEEYIETFKKYPFASISKATDGKAADTGTQYLLSLDGDKLGDFVADAAKTIDANAFTDCFKKSSVLKKYGENLNEKIEISDENRSNMKKSFAESIKEMPKIYLAIDDWKHELIGVSINYSGEDKTSVNTAFTFSYPTSIETTDTSKARSVTELQKTIEKAIEAVKPSTSTY